MFNTEYMATLLNSLSILLGIVFVPALIIAIIADIIKGKFRWSKRVLIALVIGFVVLVVLRFLSSFLGV